MSCVNVKCTGNLTSHKVSYATLAIWTYIRVSVENYLFTVAKNFVLKVSNRPFPSSLVPLFQSESKCETFHMKMTLIRMKMKLYAELNFILKVSHLDS